VTEDSPSDGGVEHGSLIGDDPADAVLSSGVEPGADLPYVPQRRKGDRAGRRVPGRRARAEREDPTTHRKMMEALRYGWRNGERQMMIAAGLMMIVMMVASAFGAVALFGKVVTLAPNPVEIQSPATVSSFVPGVPGPATDNGVLRFTLDECNTTKTPLALQVQTRWIKYTKIGGAPVAVVPGKPGDHVLLPGGPCRNGDVAVTGVAMAVDVPPSVAALPGVWQYRGDVIVDTCLESGSMTPAPTNGNPGAVAVPICTRRGATLDSTSWFTDQFTVAAKSK
jgi:hypothetical protein